ncbi:sugar transferase, partial [Rhizobium johnstonii]
MTWEAHSFEAWSRVGRSAKGADLHSSRPRAAGRSSKRALDLVIAVTALILLSPLLLIVAMIVKMSDRGPVFYSHTRIGVGGAPFGCLKFRTMKTN